MKTIQCLTAAILFFSITSVFSGVAASFWQLEEATPLMKAAKKGDLSRVKQLLSKGEGEVSEENNGGSTPLIFAASEGQLNVARFLIEQGADPNKCANSNVCPLWHAIQYGSYDLAALLIKAGANPRINPGINALEHSALKKAAADGRLDLVRLLLDNGAEIDHQGQPWGSTALAMAVRVGEAKTAKYLIEKGANIREVTEKIYYDGETALEIAERVGHTEVVTLVKAVMEKTAYKPKYSFDAILSRLFSDNNFDMQNEGKELDAMLKQQTQENLRFILNTIYARKNYKFDDTDLIKFFQKRFPNYKPTEQTIDLSDLDRRNEYYLESLREYAKYRDAAG